MNTLLPLASLLLTLILPLAAESAPATAPVTITPARRDIHRWIAVPATTRANQEVVLCARIAGYLSAITVDRGSSVTAGQAIATVEAPELGADLVRLRAEVEVAKADLARLTTARAKAPDLVVPRSIDEADGRLRIAAANLSRTETLVSFGHIVAPFAGVVTQRWVDPGAFIAVPTAGGKTGALVTIADIATVRVIVPVPEQEVAFVKIGRPAQVRFDGFAEPLSTTVARHSHTVDAGSGTMLVELDLANPEQRLLPGMFARVRLATDLHVQELTIPVAALLSENSGASVFKLIAGVAKKTPIKIGFNDSAFVEIISGVAEDDQVLMPVTGLVDGQAIPAETKP